MRVESARALKAELRDRRTIEEAFAGPSPSGARETAIHFYEQQQSIDANPLLPSAFAPIGMAIVGTPSDARLGVRIFEDAISPRLDAAVDAIRRAARGEVDVLHVGRVHAQWHRESHRPLRGGTSVGPVGGGTGTLGYFVESPKIDGGKPLMLSCRHVLLARGAARGHAILQRSAGDGGAAKSAAAGALEAWIAPKYGSNHVDAAVATILSGIDVDRDLGDLGLITDVADADSLWNSEVEKIGRTTGHRRGKVESTEAEVVVDDPVFGRVFYVDQLEVRGRGVPLSMTGDSGSLLITREPRAAAGLVFAGSGLLSWANRFEMVTAGLGVRLIR